MSYSWILNKVESVCKRHTTDANKGKCLSKWASKHQSLIFWKKNVFLTLAPGSGARSTRGRAVIKICPFCPKKVWNLKNLSFLLIYIGKAYPIVIRENCQWQQKYLYLPLLLKQCNKNRIAPNFYPKETYEVFHYCWCFHDFIVLIYWPLIILDFALMCQGTREIKFCLF